MAQAANATSVSLPQGIRDALLLKLPEGEIQNWALEAMVVEAVREHMISRRKAASLLGFEDYDLREAFFERHQLGEYTHEMADQDLKTIANRRSR